MEWENIPCFCFIELLRLFIGVVLDAVVFVFTGIDLRATEIFSVSESESCASQKIPNDSNYFSPAS